LADAVGIGPRWELNAASGSTLTLPPGVGF